MAFLGLLALGGGGGGILLRADPGSSEHGREQCERYKNPFHGCTIGTAETRGKSAVVHRARPSWE